MRHNNSARCVADPCTCTQSLSRGQTYKTGSPPDRRYKNIETGSDSRHSNDSRLDATRHLFTDPRFLPGFTSSPASCARVPVDRRKACGLRTYDGRVTSTRLHTLRAECGLPSLQHRILEWTSTFVARFVRRRPTEQVTTQILRTYQRPANQDLDRNWVHSAADATRTVGISAFVQPGPDPPHPDLASPPPWQPKPISIVRPGAAKSKAALPTILRQESLVAIHAISTPGTTTYFTDGSVSEYAAAGAAFVCEGQAHSCRITDSVSAFQAELTAIQCALEHARNLRDGAINIITDSLSSLEALDHFSYLPTHPQCSSNPGRWRFSTVVPPLVSSTRTAPTGGYLTGVPTQASPKRHQTLRFMESMVQLVYRKQAARVFLSNSSARYRESPVSTFTFHAGH
ncbi:hypothetical protein GWK47_016182 [Chionoecetes opilio]|uniref:RNase H type-1 domain-containing protein n=1 Tax=Chionoecetes opilio TaxID=41210 RepID=A0A8J5CJT0_CHIOP|nr:hypothetical protein GWK47_016182 [Chionoecetes opilio]